MPRPAGAPGRRPPPAGHRPAREIYPLGSSGHPGAPSIRAPGAEKGPPGTGTDALFAFSGSWPPNSGRLACPLWPVAAMLT